MKTNLKEIWVSIKRLHSLGIVHNDIKPVDIMFDKDSILIDLDSCRYIGEFLHETKTKSTNHWNDLPVDMSLEKNGLDAFKDLQIWLTGSADEELLFK
ncbi:uncharacterized protein N7479_010062 [Penicillium vulpinum]|uniref:uncharacterized protein n=1 Tax=Penicillium vulpinum TaxID=29845 RepID=UPI002548D68D|nr:uncharacterized protein N7479_010062 [Penicillium vulpinum]KAJ5951649.1 hypothetical protein N7479_010062 [Penicillium vulpinum]